MFSEYCSISVLSYSFEFVWFPDITQPNYSFGCFVIGGGVVVAAGLLQCKINKKISKWHTKVYTRVSLFSTFFKNWYATNRSPWWHTSIASSKNSGQFRHHLELAPELIILQRTSLQYTKEILVYQFFGFVSIICSC